MSEFPKLEPFEGVAPRFRTPDELGEVVKERKGHLFVEVMHCIHCERITIAPTTDDCICGAECYPVTKWVALGVPHLVGEMKGG